jgi:hypothetical protein
MICEQLVFAHSNLSPGLNVYARRWRQLDAEPTDPPRAPTRNVHFGTESVKTFCVGAGVALAAGLALGAALKPNLAADDRPAGPQVLSESAPRPAGPLVDDDPSMRLAQYSGVLPDYVLGTDWTRPSERAARSAAPPAPTARLAAEPAAPPDATWAPAPPEPAPAEADQAGFVR